MLRGFGQCAPPEEVKIKTREARFDPSVTRVTPRERAAWLKYVNSLVWRPARPQPQRHAEKIAAKAASTTESQYRLLDLQPRSADQNSMDAAEAKAARKEAKRKKKEAKLLKRKLEGAAEPEAGGQSRAAKKKKAKKAKKRAAEEEAPAEDAPADDAEEADAAPAEEVPSRCGHSFEVNHRVDGVEVDARRRPRPRLAPRLQNPAPRAGRSAAAEVRRQRR